MFSLVVFTTQTNSKGNHRSVRILNRSTVLKDKFEISKKDNLVDLGLDSAARAELIQKINEHYETNIRLEQIYTDTSIKEIENLILQ